MEQHADETQDRVRQRAYELWEQHGRHEGHEAEFWHQAERELKGEASSSDTSRGVTAQCRLREERFRIGWPRQGVMTESAQRFMLGELVRNIPLRHRCDWSARHAFSGS